ncbi:MAG: response regulator, partial [Nitrospinota bacterium]
RPISHKNLDAVNPALFFEKGKLEFLFFSLIRLLSYSADSRGESPEIHINTILQDGYVKIVFSDSSNPFPDDFISLSGLLSMIRGYPLEFGALVVMVFSVVHDQGGKIRGQRKITTALDEEREKLSLRFIMELPVSPVVGKPKKVPLSTVPHTVAVSLKGRKVLVVDDEKTIRIWLNSLLVERGATPTLCSDGVEAIQEVEKNRFDFILSDVKMPELSGYELGEWLEKQSPDMLPRLILITGLRDKELDEFCLQKRCHSLTKPFTSDALLSLVSKILDQVTI